MIDRDDFLQAICSAPDDDLPRLVFADWLEEHDEPERAEFIRVQCELVKIGPAWKDGGPGRLEARHVGGGEYVLETFDAPPIGSRLDARAIWITKKKSGLLRGLRVIRVGAAQGSDGFPVNAIRDEYSGNTAARRIKTLQRREQELFKLHGYQWADVFSGYKMEQIGQGLSGTTVTARYLFPDESMTDQFRFEFRRGFIESITCSAEDWLAHEAALTWCVGIDGVPPMVTGMICKWCGKAQPPEPRSIGLDFLCRCGGGWCTGRVPRPFPSTAQPIREVHLTTLPEVYGQLGVLDPAWGQLEITPNVSFTSDHWPGTTFHLPPISE